MRVAGYYTLAAGSFDVSCLPAAEHKKWPRHPLPTVHLGRLAVDRACRGKRLGETLLFHALHAALGLSEQQACSTAYFLLIAGQETTRQLIAVAFEQLLAPPAAWRQVAAEPGGATEVVERALREHSPVSTWRRTTTSWRSSACSTTLGSASRPWSSAVPQDQRRPDEGIHASAAFRWSVHGQRTAAHHP